MELVTRHNLQFSEKYVIIKITVGNLTARGGKMKAEERQAYNEVSAILLEQIMGQKKSLQAQAKILRSFLKMAPKEDYVEASIILSEQLKEQLESLQAQIELWESLQEELQQ